MVYASQAWVQRVNALGETVRTFFYLLLLFVSLSATATEKTNSEYIVLPQGIVARSSEVNRFGSVDWGQYPPTYNWGDNTVIDLNDEPLLFLTHHSTVYDRKGVARGGAKEAIDAFFDSHAPIFYLYSFRFAAENTFQFLKLFSEFIGVESEGGENKLQYKNGRNFFFTGGHFSMCLCETIRDTLRNVVDASLADPTHFYFIEDGVYDLGKSLKDIAKAYKKSGYRRLVYDKLLKNLGSKQLCAQNWKHQPEVSIKDYKIDIVDHNGKKVALSNGNGGAFVFHLIDSQDVETLLQGM